MIRRSTKLWIVALALVTVGSEVALQAELAGERPSPTTEPPFQSALDGNPVRFAVIGDSGTGGREQYDVAREMEAYHAKMNFDFVIMLGDNIYGSHTPKDFVQKFELPYQPLLNSGIKFYASLGNHDNPDDERSYKPFNMGGRRYYSFEKSDVAFFALDSNDMDSTQLTWLEQSLRDSHARWKICFFHHPLYSNGKTHGPDTRLRAQLEPLFEHYGVNAVFSGHEHVYERLAPKHDIYYFILGNSAKLMAHDFRKSKEMTQGFDTDRSFMVVEITVDNLYFQTISRTGAIIDSGACPKPGPHEMH